MQGACQHSQSYSFNQAAEEERMECLRGVEIAHQHGEADASPASPDARGVEEELDASFGGRVTGREPSCIARR